MDKAEAAFSSVIIIVHVDTKLPTSLDQYLHLLIFQFYLIYYIANRLSLNEHLLI